MLYKVEHILRDIRLGKTPYLYFPDHGFAGHSWIEGARIKFHKMFDYLEANVAPVENIKRMFLIGSTVAKPYIGIKKKRFFPFSWHKFKFDHYPPNDLDCVFVYENGTQIQSQSTKGDLNYGHKENDGYCKSWNFHDKIDGLDVFAITESKLEQAISNNAGTPVHVLQSGVQILGSDWKHKDRDYRHVYYNAEWEDGACGIKLAKWQKAGWKEFLKNELKQKTSLDKIEMELNNNNTRTYVKNRVHRIYLREY